jgi:AcrR family transcriptional regulator
MVTAGEKERTTGKERLLQAAEEAFREGGYNEVGVAQILELAGVQAPTLYHHFRDKEHLYLAWATLTLGRLGAEIDEALKQEMTSEAALTAFGKAMLGYQGLQVPRVLRDVETMARPESQEELLSAYLQAVQNPLTGILLKGISRGEIAGSPLNALAEAYLGGLHALGRTQWRSERTAEEVASWWASVFLHGCGPSLPKLAAVIA